MSDLLTAAKNLCDDFGDNLQEYDAHRYILVEELRAAIAAPGQQARIAILEKLLTKCLEWHANYPHGNRDWEEDTSNELYNEIQQTLADK